jgi:hypothetical protein
VKLDPQVDPEMKDLPVQLVLLAQSARLVHLENLDLKAHPAKKDLLVLVDALETRDPPVPLALSDLPVLLDFPYANEIRFQFDSFKSSYIIIMFRDHLDNLDLPALLESVVPLVKLAQWVLKALL